MGAQQSTVGLKKEELESYEKKSRFRGKEIQSLYKQFRKEAPSGTISRGEFGAVVSQMALDDELLQEVLFHSFDQDGDGVISFNDFLASLSVMTRGSSEEKLEFSFRMYDYTDTGSFSKEDIQRILSSLFSLIGALQTVSGRTYDVPELRADDFFSLFQSRPASSDDNIAEMPTSVVNIRLDEYKKMALENMDIIHGLKLFNTDDST